MSADTSTNTELRSRRALLAGALGGVGALAAAMIGRPQPLRADDGDPVILGATQRGSNTKIQTNEESRALILESGAIGLDAHGGEVAVLGRSVGETGVLGSSYNGVGVWGSSDKYVGVLGTSRSGYAGRFEGKIYGSSHIDLRERSTPAKPPLNHARLFVRDDGNNHTQLCVKFPNGKVRVLATA